MDMSRDMPKTGVFIVVWCLHGEPGSEKLQWSENNKLQMWNYKYHCWENASENLISWYSEHDAYYFTP